MRSQLVSFLNFFHVALIVDDMLKSLTSLSCINNPGALNNSSSAPDLQYFCSEGMFSGAEYQSLSFLSISTLCHHTFLSLLYIYYFPSQPQLSDREYLETSNMLKELVKTSLKYTV